MSTKITRRTALAGSSAMALAPAVAVSLPANATDEAWAEYQAAVEAQRANRAAADAFEATLPIGRPPRADWESGLDLDRYRDEQDAWHRERQRYPENPYDADDVCDALADELGAAEERVLEAPAATLTDLERKLIAATGCASDVVPAETVQRLLADVRALRGEAA